MLHFNADLTQAKTPGAFGWDITAVGRAEDDGAVVHGTSPYLIMTKYNNYAGRAGTG